MNLYLRLVWLLLTFKFRRKLIPPFDISKLHFRVLPNDIDTNLHMNNGRYLTLMDLGRTDLILRGGLWRIILREGYQPMLAGATIRYRRELKPFQAFRLESRIVFWSDKNFVMEQKFMAKDNSGNEYTAALALLKGGIYSRKLRQFIQVATLFADIGYVGPSPDATADVEAFLKSESALKRG